MQRATSGSLVQRAVWEAIDALAAPKIRTAVLELALRWARLDVIPERGSEVGVFVRGALFHALEQVLGDTAAESVLAQLEPMAVMLEDSEVSSVRPSRPAPEAPIEDDEDDFPAISFAPPPDARSQSVGGMALYPTAPAPAILPVILIASVDPSGVDELNKALAGVASIEALSDALSVLEHLEREDTSVVVIDCRRPAVSVETLIALAPDLPRDAQIVLWGERHDLEHRMQAMGIPIPSSWVCCGPDASAEDVAAVARILMG